MSRDTGGSQPPKAAVLSRVQARPLLEAREDGEAGCATSADLGLSQTRARLAAECVYFDTGARASWSAFDDSGCFEVWGDGIERIQQMSTLSHRLASLYPTAGPPALMLSGTLMHRIKGLDPETLAQATTENFFRLFSKAEPA